MARLDDQLNPSEFVEISQLREDVTRNGIVDTNNPDVVAELCNFAVTELIRRSMRRKGEDGYPLFPSIVVPQQDGKTVRKYIREKKMKKGHYDQFATQWHDRAVYCMRMENATKRRSWQRYGGQMHFPWPGIGFDLTG